MAARPFALRADREPDHLLARALNTPTWHGAVLRRALPDPRESSLLRAALFTEARGCRAFEEAEGFIQQLPAALRNDDAEAKYLVPLLAAAETRLGTNLDPSIRTILRMGFVREELRGTLFREFRDRACAALRDARVYHAVAGGAAAMDQWYETLGPRHAHGIDLIVAESDIAKGVKVLTANDWIPDPAPHGSAATMRHRNGMCLRFRSSLSPWFPSAIDAEALIARARASGAGHAGLVCLQAEDALLDTCLLPLDPGWRDGVLWAADVFLMLTVERKIDWSAIVSSTSAMHASAYVLESLRYVRDMLDAPVPATVLDALENLAPVSAPAAGDVLVGQLHDRGGWHAVWREGPTGSAGLARWRLARQLLFPSADYMRRTRHISHAAFLPWHYSVRAARYLVHVARGAA